MSLRPIDSYPSKYMLPTIYKTQPGAVVNENASPVGVGSTTSDDMLTLAVRVQGQENRLKVRSLEKHVIFGFSDVFCYFYINL